MDEILYMFFDTETTGLPKKWSAPVTDTNNWPRIIQLAWVLCDSDGNYLDEQNFLIKPDGWTMPTDPFWTENGFTQEFSEEHGFPIKQAIEAFLKSYEKCSGLVAHNMDYDRPVFACELIRLGIKVAPRPKFCTMKPKEIIDFVGAKAKNGRIKWPKLIELHEKLFGEGFDDAHDALADVRACARSFFELRKRKIIKL